jgi:hypothetical protein
MKITKNEKKDNNTYCQYKLKNDGYYPMQATVKKVPAGFYKPAHDSYTGEYYLEPKKIITPKLYLLPGIKSTRVKLQCHHVNAHNGEGCGTNV